MNTEIRLSVTVPLPDDPAAVASTTVTVLSAWAQFTTAIKGTGVIGNDFYVGPTKQRRRRRGRPKLVEPPSAA